MDPKLCQGVPFKTTLKRSPTKNLLGKACSKSMLMNVPLFLARSIIFWLKCFISTIFTTFVLSRLFFKF